MTIFIPLIIIKLLAVLGSFGLLFIGCVLVDAYELIPLFQMPLALGPFFLLCYTLSDLIVYIGSLI
jgi:hypothetical protein